MITAYVRVDPTHLVPDDVDFVLDIFGDGDARSTVDLGRGFFGSGSPVPVAVREFFILAAAAYCLDKVVARERSPTLGRGGSPSTSQDQLEGGRVLTCRPR